MDAMRILDTFYPGASKTTNQALRAKRVWDAVRDLKKTPDKIRKKGKKWIPYLVAGSLIAAVWIVAHLYYFNVLVDLQFNVEASWAQVEVQLERRYHIQQNLTQVVVNYSKYEKDTLTELIEIRASAMAAKQATADGTDDAAPKELSFTEQLKSLTKPDLDKLFPDVLLVAEQYPDLKLTENFQQFSTAIIDTETKIADQITEYNTAVNIYTTERTQFPGNIFAATFGFPPHDFYLPDKVLLNFTPAKY